MRKFMRENWDEIIAYTLTLLGMLVSPFLPIIQIGSNVKMAYDLLTILVYAFVALFLTFVQEYIAPEKEDTAATKAQKKLAKKRHLIRRFLFAMVFGLGSPAIVGKAIVYFTSLTGIGG